MGKLIKNHLARLVVLTAAVYQAWAGLMGFFWPKVFWDFETKLLDHAVKPIPILQILNVFFGLLVFAIDWPLRPLTRWALHDSIEVRLFYLPMATLVAALLYQGTNSALYYCIAIGLYFWAYTEGEVICPEPWTLPRKKKPAAQKV